MLDTAAATNVAFRRALPPGWQDDPAFAIAFATQAAPYLAALDARVVDTAAHAALIALFASSRSEANAAIDQLAFVAKLTDGSVLHVNENQPFLVRERAVAVDLLLPGNILGLSKSCLPALARLQAGPVRYADLAPELGARDRELLVKTLVREGIVVIEDTRNRAAKAATGTGDVAQLVERRVCNADVRGSNPSSQVSPSCGVPGR